MKVRIAFAILILSSQLVVSVPVSGQGEELALTETQEMSLGLSRFTMDYPTGWIAASNRSMVVINELEADHNLALEGPFITKGYSIRFETSRIATLKRDGFLSDEPTLEELWQATMTTNDYQEAADVTSTQVFGGPALQAQTLDGQGNAVLSIQGFAETHAYQLSLSAPSSETLVAFLPTWQSMLSSIRRVQGRQNIGDYSLYFECTVQGSPTVILEAGWGGGGVEGWSRVQRKVAEFTQVCAYDRLGMGMSDTAATTELRTGQDVVDDLHALLEMTQVEGPYVLVGHSLGGAITRIYADQYRDEVVGMVLVDASHEEVPRYREEILGSEMFAEAMAALYEGNLEALDYRGILEQTRATQDLGDMPLVVLTARLYSVEPPYTEETARREHETWMEILQPRLAELSSNSTHIIVEDSDHLIPWFSPQSVVDAVSMVVEEIRMNQ